MAGRISSSVARLRASDASEPNSLLSVKRPSAGDELG